MRRLVAVVLPVVILALMVACGQRAPDVPDRPSCVDVQPTPVPAVWVQLPASLVEARYEAVDADLSIAYLVDTYHMSRDEAERQLNLQREAGDLYPLLLGRYPNQLGELRLEHEPGTIVVPTTDPDTLSSDVELTRYPHRSSIVIERVVWSRRTVEAIADCLHNRLGPTDEEIQFGLDVDAVDGQIWIEAADTEAGRSFLANTAVTAEISAGAGVVATRTHPWHPPGVQKGG